jgi:hypothetical protein
MSGWVSFHKSTDLSSPIAAPQNSTVTGSPPGPEELDSPEPPQALSVTRDAAASVAPARLSHREAIGTPLPPAVGPGLPFDHEQPAARVVDERTASSALQAASRT